MAGKYTAETVKNIKNSEIVKELLEAQQHNIATGNPDVGLISTEITARLKEIEGGKEPSHIQGGWKDKQG